MSKFSRMGAESGLQKDERKFKLKTLIEQGKALTVSACAQQMRLSRHTILTYLKELKISLYDDVKKEMSYKEDDFTEVFPF